VVKLGAVAGTEQLAFLVKRAAGPLDAWLDRVVRAGRGDATRTAAGSPVNRRIRIALPSRDSSASTMVDPPARTGISSHCGSSPPTTDAVGDGDRHACEHDDDVRGRRAENDAGDANEGQTARAMGANVIARPAGGPTSASSIGRIG